MSSLDKAIKYYKRMSKDPHSVKPGCHGPLSAHYALGALEVLERVAALRNAYRNEMRQAWIDRAADGGDRYSQAKWVHNELNNLMIGEK